MYQKIIPKTLISFYPLAIAILTVYINVRLLPSLLNPHVILYPYFLSKGFILFKNIIDQQTPLLPHLLLWLSPVFGRNLILTASIFHGILICITVILTLVWLYKVSGLWSMAAGGIFFIAWSNLYGYWATSYYEIVLGPIFFLIFLLTTIRVEKQKKIFLIMGMLTGIGILIKQQTMILIVPQFISAIRQYKTKSCILLGLSYLLLGICVPVLAYIYYYSKIGGNINDLIYWTLTYNFTSSYRIQGAEPPSASQLLDILPTLILILPFVHTIFYPEINMKPGRVNRTWLLMFFVSSTIFTFPRYSDERHIAIALPFITAISGITCADIVGFAQNNPSRRFFQNISIAIIVFWVLSSFLIYWPIIKSPLPRQFGEYSNLLPLAKKIKKEISTQQGVVLLPTDERNGNLYYILQQPPPPYYLSFYPWFTNKDTINQWLLAVESEKPKTLIYFKGFEWVNLTSCCSEILLYIDNNYQFVRSMNWEKYEVELFSRKEGR